MNSNKFVKTVLVGTGTLLILAGGMTAVIDPFFHYHKPLKQLEYPLERGKERYLNNGIIQNFDYDAAITGTSMMQNFKTSQFDDLFGTHSVKVTLTGQSMKKSVLYLTISLILNIFSAVWIIIRFLMTSPITIMTMFQLICMIIIYGTMSSIFLTKISL